MAAQLEQGKQDVRVGHELDVLRRLASMEIVKEEPSGAHDELATLANIRAQLAALADETMLPRTREALSVKGWEALARFEAMGNWSAYMAEVQEAIARTVAER